MSILRRETAGDLMSLRAAMNRLMEESFVRPFGMFEDFAPALPAVDVYETDEEIIVKATVPGVKPEDLEINAIGNTLSIKGETKEEEETKKGAYLHRERRYGAFNRSFTLPTTIDANKAAAEFEHGVLTLTLPKAELVKPKSLKIKAK